MWKLKNLVENKDFDDKVIISKIEETVKCFFSENETKKEEYDKFYWTLYEKMYGKHFNDDLVERAIKEMHFNNPDFKPALDKNQIKNIIEQAHRVAEQNYSKKGITAPSIPSNLTLCDMQYVYNMIAADYPTSHMGDSSKIGLMAYEFLSDPDAPEGKAYLYYGAMSS